MGVDFDASELDAFAADLGNAPTILASDVTSVIQKGALNIKGQLVEEMSASQHFKGVAGAMSYETAAVADGFEALIGPDKDRPGGALANIAYWGSSRGGGTVPDPLGALLGEVPNVEKFLGDAIEKAVGS